MNSAAAGYRDYADLADEQIEGTDYKVHERANAQSSIAVIAPHGGGIERYPHTLSVICSALNRLQKPRA